jgi:hypothetical protein
VGLAGGCPGNAPTAFLRAWHGLRGKQREADVSGMARLRHCWHCGAELGGLIIAEWEPGDTCGKVECEREVRRQEEAARAEAVMGVGSRWR